MTVAAAERVAPDGDVFALDVSVDALEELRRTCTAPNVFYFLGSANVLPLPDDAVDAVLTLTELHDKPEAAREFWRVLRSGGRISICEPADDDLEQVFREAGFGDVRSDGTETAVYVTGTKP